jgi:hypothetical protein
MQLLDIGETDPENDFEDIQEVFCTQAPLG